MSILKVGSIVNPADNVSLDITDIARSVLPTGTVIYLAGSTVPTGFLKCNGAELLRSVYTDLFSAIGDAYGAGDGATSFLLPDLRGEFIRGWDDSRGIDAGRTLGSSQGEAFKSHSHGWSATTVNRTFTSLLGNTNGSNNKYGYVTGGFGSEISSFTISNNGGTETRPRNIALMALIKY